MEAKMEKVDFVDIAIILEFDYGLSSWDGYGDTNLDMDYTSDFHK
jgi:hypothetical protein